MVTEQRPPAQVLIVEDDPMALEALRTILEVEGYHIASVGNGREALNYLRKHEPPSVILLDLLMPVMNGWEFRRHQKRDPTLALIPVIVCSGIDDIQAEAALIGADACLQKPIEPHDLTETVGRFCLAQERCPNLPRSCPTP